MAKLLRVLPASIYELAVSWCLGRLALGWLGFGWLGFELGSGLVRVWVQRAIRAGVALTLTPPVLTRYTQSKNVFVAAKRDTNLRTVRSPHRTAIPATQMSQDHGISKCPTRKAEVAAKQAAKAAKIAAATDAAWDALTEEERAAIKAQREAAKAAREATAASEYLSGSSLKAQNGRQIDGAQNIVADALIENATEQSAGLSGEGIGNLKKGSWIKKGRVIILDGYPELTVMRASWMTVKSTVLQSISHP
ncbi:hypothetical protein B0H16DRAFT_1453379 [Mycena metata]|uniref:Uncharacterized protein n=1 Tax=Mycena metata TaxID=1033252 RepID=A0AAD7JM37_9AGAR|nr:hypothetical protein B0H16DRAFT_1453379 [Mycena metata]